MEKLPDFRSKELKALAFLLQSLTDQQRQTYLDHGFFDIVKGSRVYRCGLEKYVEVFQKGELLGRYCIHTEDAIPSADNLLAQKLMIEANERMIMNIGIPTTNLLAGVDIGRKMRWFFFPWTR